MTTMTMTNTTVAGSDEDRGDAGCGRAVVAVMVAALWSSAPAAADEPISEVKYSCADDKAIAAIYYADKVDLDLSDGRTISLPQAMSGSGIRYANADESFVFWSKGKTAFVTEGDTDKPTYADCIEQQG